MFVFRVVFLASLPSGIRFRVSHSPGFMMKWGMERRLRGHFRALAVLLQKFTQVKY